MKIIRHAVQFQSLPPVIRSKIREVAEDMSIAPCDILSTRKNRLLVVARDRVFAELRQGEGKPAFSLQSLAHYWGMDHSTVQKAIVRHLAMPVGQFKGIVLDKSQSMAHGEDSAVEQSGSSSGS